MPRRKRAASATSSSVRLPIYTLSGGVSTQAQSKRLPSESSILDNVLLSIERSIEKRPGFNILPQSSATGVISNFEAISNNERFDLYPLEELSTIENDYLFYWFTINEANRFLIAVNYSASIAAGTYTHNTSANYITVSSPTEEHLYSVGDSIQLDFTTVSTGSLPTSGEFFVTVVEDAYTFRVSCLTTLPAISGSLLYYDKLIYAFQLNTDDTWTNRTQGNQTNNFVKLDTRLYVTFGNNTNNAIDVLKITPINKDLLILNKLVKAGFTSDNISNPTMFNLDGSTTSTPDVIGKSIKYYTTIRYSFGEDNKWYINNIEPNAMQFSIANKATGQPVAVDDTITFTTSVELPDTLTNGEELSIESINPNTYIVYAFDNPVSEDPQDIIVRGNQFSSVTSVEVSGQIFYSNTNMSIEQVVFNTSYTILNDNEIIIHINKIPLNSPSPSRSLVYYDTRRHVNVTGLNVRVTNSLKSVDSSSYNSVIYAGPNQKCIWLQGPENVSSANVSWLTTAPTILTILLNYAGSVNSSALGINVGDYIYLDMYTSASPTYGNLSGYYTVLTTVYAGGATGTNTITVTTSATIAGNFNNQTCIVTKLMPQLSSVAPTTLLASAAGSATITVTGSNFRTNTTSPLRVFVDGVQGTNVVVASSTSFSFIPPRLSSGYKTITIHNSSDTEPSPVSNQFIYKNHIENIIEYTAPTTSIQSKIKPNISNKYYAVLNQNNYFVFSGFQAESTGKTFTVEEVKGTVPSASSANVWVYSGYFPYVDTFVWHDTAQAYYGQSLNDFSEVKLPPSYVEKIANNGLNLTAGTNLYEIDTNAQTVLANLYNYNGLGKIYYIKSPYLSAEAGYYRVLDNNSIPYTQKIRSPDCFSVLDKKRFPQQIIFNASTPNSLWTMSPIEWEHRTNGDKYTNPGPTIFSTSDNEKAVQSRISAITTFRDRLYFASGNTVFTSALGNLTNLFLNDPTAIVDTDPIDIKASSTVISEITSLLPFSTFLFMTTSGSVQYELKGSQNQITALTAEISPTAFYSTSNLTEPLTQGSSIFFLDSSRLYLYVSNDTTNLAVGLNLSLNISDYLPTQASSIFSSASNNIIGIVDRENTNTLYFHLSRFSGDKILQNAFFRYIRKPLDKIHINESFQDIIYSVVSRPTTSKQIDTITLLNQTPVSPTEQPTKRRYYIEASSFKQIDPEIPRLDAMLRVLINTNNTSYNQLLNQTTIKIPYSFPLADLNSIELVTDSTWVNDLDYENKPQDRSYEVAKPYAYTIKERYISLIFVGRFIPITGNPFTQPLVDWTQNRYVYIGFNYLMKVKLSTQFYRDQNNNAIDGILSLRTLAIRHKDTGNYDISVSHRGRTPSIYTFYPRVVGELSTTLGLLSYENDGEFHIPILGFSNTVDIEIQSNYSTPLNIVNLEFKGKFMPKFATLNT